MSSNACVHALPFSTASAPAAARSFAANCSCKRPRFTTIHRQARSSVDSIQVPFHTQRRLACRSQSGDDPETSTTASPSDEQGMPSSNDRAVSAWQPEQFELAGDNTAFLAKLLCASFAGAAVIKFGSLTGSFFFTPNAALALAMVFVPPVLYGLYIARK